MANDYVNTDGWDEFKKKYKDLDQRRLWII